MQRCEINPNDHLGLVFSIAKRAAAHWGGSAEEWSGEAWLALQDAVRTFDPTKSSFSTHACRTMWWKLYKSRMGTLGYKMTKKGYCNPHQKFHKKLATRIPDQVGDTATVTVQWKQLTTQQHAVCLASALGLRPPEIARSLNISRQRVFSLLTKLRGQKITVSYEQSRKISKVRGELR